jgi:hypothetical protein
LAKEHNLIRIEAIFLRYPVAGLLMAAIGIWLACATICFGAERPHPVEIWLGPVDPITRVARKWDASADYMDLFRSDASWKTVEESIRVFKIGPGFVQQGAEADLRLIFSELKKHNIKLALEIGMATRSEHCNQNTEAYGAPGLVAGLLGRVKRLGGEPDYIAMDEPLYYGHEYKGGGACNLTPTQIAQDVAPNVKLAKSMFPNVQIGDVEVVYFSKDFVHATQEWVDAYRDAVGFNFAFLHADVGWSSRIAMRNLVPLVSFVRSRGVKFGVIYNGNADDDTDESWVRGTMDHFRYIESGLELIPDQAIFHTWVPFPTRNLPESQFGTLTNLVLQYLRPRSELTVRHDGTGFQGKLTDMNGMPIGAAPVSLSAVGAVSDEPAAVKRLTGKVFLRASAAMLVVRANKELQCPCLGAATAIIGKSLYYEEDRRNVQEIPGTKIDVDAHGSVYENSRKFPVTPGATFTLEVPYSARIGTEHDAYIAILFVDGMGHEVGRQFLWMESLGRAVGATATGPDGTFRFNVDRTIEAARPQEFEVQFSGSDQFRGAAAVVR